VTRQYAIERIVEVWGSFMGEFSCSHEDNIAMKQDLLDILQALGCTEAECASLPPLTTADLLPLDV